MTGHDRVGSAGGLGGRGRRAAGCGRLVAWRWRPAPGGWPCRAPRRRGPGLAPYLVSVRGGGRVVLVVAACVLWPPGSRARAGWWWAAPRSAGGGRSGVPAGRGGGAGAARRHRPAGPARRQRRDGALAVAALEPGGTRRRSDRASPTSLGGASGGSRWPTPSPRCPSASARPCGRSPTPWSPPSATAWPSGPRSSSSRPKPGASADASRTPRARKLPVRLSFPLVCCILPAFGLLTVAPLIAGALGSLHV